mmetsp:Transcript_5401/g.9520  ORF Transcript_5401/g.9520 Transcript_5401/m.9520 type:complete len:508 (-) Transcript_5401:85-1608(-)
MVVLDYLDSWHVALVEWVQTRPGEVAKALSIGSDDDDDVDDDRKEDVVVGLHIPLHIRVFANAVMDFGPFRVPVTEAQEARFAQLQRAYSNYTLGDTTEEQGMNDTTCFRLSPRMMVKQGPALKQMIILYLDEMSRSVENQLLQQVEEERTSKEERLTKRKLHRRKRKKHKKKDSIQQEQQQQQQQPWDDPDSKKNDPQHDVYPTTTEEETTPTLVLEKGNPQPEHPCRGSDLNRIETLDTKHRRMILDGSSDIERDGLDREVGIVTNNNKEHVDSDVRRTAQYLANHHETKHNKKDVILPQKEAVSYLEAAKKCRTHPDAPSLQSPITHTTAANVEDSSSSGKCIQTEHIREDGSHDKEDDIIDDDEDDEQEEVRRLENHIQLQRQNHLEMIQQVQLRAFIAETKATAALERSRALEQQLLDATYPETTQQSQQSHHQQRNAVHKTTKERLQLELRKQRRDHLAMMQRVQLRTYLAETKARAAEERSTQLTELLKNAKQEKEGVEV